MPYLPCLTPGRLEFIAFYFFEIKEKPWITIIDNDKPVGFESPWQGRRDKPRSQPDDVTALVT